MKKRRLFSLLLAAAMSLALVSCGNGGDTSGNGTADGGNASQVDADGDGYKDAVKLAISTDPNLDPWLTGMAYDLKDVYKRQTPTPKRCTYFSCGNASITLRVIGGFPVAKIAIAP